MLTRLIPAALIAAVLTPFALVAPAHAQDEAPVIGQITTENAAGGSRPTSRSIPTQR